MPGIENTTIVKVRQVPFQTIGLQLRKKIIESEDITESLESRKSLMKRTQHLGVLFLKCMFRKIYVLALSPFKLLCIDYLHVQNYTKSSVLLL